MKIFLFIISFLLFSDMCKAQYQKISSAKNSFGFYYSSNTCLTYNKTLDALALTQRITSNWPDSAFPVVPNPLGLKGYLVTKWSTNLGVTWDSLCYYQNDVHYPRYPSGVIFNPPGNTNINNAYAVGFGATTTGTNWDGIYFASTKLNGSLSTKPNMHTPTNNDQQWFPIDSLSIGDSIYFSPTSASVTDSAIWICATVVDGLYQPKAIAVIKGILVDSSFHWEVDTIIRNQWVVNNKGRTYLSKEPKIAFHPQNPLIGYILADGVDSLETNNDLKSVFLPMVWKTLDGGAHWNRVNQNYNWLASSNDRLLFGNLNGPRYSQNSSGNLYPNFINKLGEDILVDSIGNLNFVASPIGTYSYDRDSLDFSYYRNGFEYNGLDNCGEPYLIHFTTNGDGTWKKILLSKLYTSNLYKRDDENWWANPFGDELDYNNRIQISRTYSGNKIIVSWIDTDLTDIPNSIFPPYLNIKPSLKSIAYDVNTGKYTNLNSKHKSQTPSGGFWWMLASDVVVDNGVQQILPSVFISQITSTGNFNTTNNVSVYFVNNMSFNNSDYTSITANSNLPLFDGCVFINEINELLTSKLLIYPNPTLSKLNVYGMERDCKISIYNIAGQLMKVEYKNKLNNNSEIDIMNFEAGMYLLEIESLGQTNRYKIIKE